LIANRHLGYSLSLANLSQRVTQMIAHSAILKELAASAGRPVSEVLQAARVLGENGLYDRPGKGARNPRLTLLSLANVALAIAGGGPMTAAETVRQLRPLVPTGTRETWGESKNKLLSGDSGVNYFERFVDDRPLWSGANLGEALEELIDLVAAVGAEHPWREADPGLVGFFRDAEFEFTIPAGVGPAAIAFMFVPVEGETYRRLWSCRYLPAEANGALPQLHGASRDGVIRFSFIEALGKVWREVRVINTLPKIADFNERVKHHA
jgi:hypothetical protein